ncbi:secreted RxLR effector protein 78-like [Rutidosis leptorrhynchoides]|uniref:secreted RxLR effector protein 78-like n=1 Tax=Rutidosis leptorrhynchoides TaxID=125765 RepID=UPI003A99BDB0
MVLSSRMKTVDYLKHKRVKSLIFMVDFEKAFDSLNWDFLMEIMEIMGFGVKWRKWILSCLHSASISALVNGSPTNEFKFKRGVRKGDPLSPFLFILAAEGLNVLTKSVVASNSFKGVEIGRDKIPISHIQYADDTIFFGEWSIDNIRNLMKLL